MTQYYIKIKKIIDDLKKQHKDQNYSNVDVKRMIKNTKLNN